MTYLLRITPLLIAGLIGMTAAPAVAAEPSASDVRFFETKVRPVLVDQCFKCHGPDKQRGDLRLDSPEALKRAGGSGTPLFDFQKPDASLLLRAVRHADDEIAPMPPDSKLKDAEIAVLAEWVKRGAPFPAVKKAAADDPRNHWAFQTIKRPGVPEITKHKEQISNPIDAFVFAKLQAAGLEPAPPADRRTLIRRVTFDLTGLPPTPEEIDAFIKDDSPAAFARVVDRLLASPAYGERWGRHWLDVARYADSNGLDENVAHGNAWRYRDYVINAFNADKPYNEFLLEQIAGDLIPFNSTEERHEHLVATGFLALGPKVIAEPDEKKMELDIVDEQIDTLGRSVMGLTLGCARCHDHKFDPISLDDYYALAGVFVSTKTMETFKKVARWYENPLASAEEVKAKAEHDAEVAKLKARIKSLTGKKDDAAKAEMKKLQADVAAMEKNAPELASAMGVTEGEPTNAPLLRRGNHLNPGDLVPRRFPEILTAGKQDAIPKDHSGRLELANWLASPNHPLTARVMVNRIWRWHFGTGLVRSVDNFGLLGDKPTHPELLDWLASDFVKQGWSVKRMHRLILLSSTYQMSSEHDAKAAAADPENRLLWRANLRRLEAEAIRDSLLAVSGLLDRAAGGPALSHVKNRGYLFDHTSKDLTSYDTDRRSVYLPVIRNNLYAVFQLFDAPDPAVPTGDRATTTVPTQALFFMNSDLASRSANALAERLLVRSSLDDTGRVKLLFEITYGRPPTQDEIDRLTKAVAALAKDDDTDSRRKAWVIVGQAVLASNEFIHLR